MNALIAMIPLLVAGTAPTPPTADAPALEIWVRGDGPLGADGSPRRLRTVKVELERSGGKSPGVRLAALIAKAKPEARVNLAILHFSNGMAVPLSFRDAGVMKRLDPVVARQPRGARVVVREPWHPDVPARAEKDVSPWQHADQLVSVELVETGPYYKQFQAGGQDLQRGFALFKESCQFCHGARGVGAKFGWDFVEPYPVHSFRRPATHLYSHVAMKPGNAAEKGLLMPAMKYMTVDDANAIWKWLEALATKPMPPYTTVALGR